MIRPRIGRFLQITILAIGSVAALAQAPKAAAPAQRAAASAVAETQDAEATKQEQSALLDRLPPAVRRTLALDPALLTNASYLEPYPGLAAFIEAHPDILHNPSFYLGTGDPYPASADDRARRFWEDILGGLAALTGFGMGIGLLVWLIRTFLDYRRWSRLATVQATVHAKILDRFTQNEELLAYIQSPAGARFLQSAPIALDSAPRSVGAPLGRILWSVQGGVVLIAAGIGLEVVSKRVDEIAAQPLQAIGIIAIMLGLGFLVSAAASFFISRRLGLIEATPAIRPAQVPEA